MKKEGKKDYLLNDHEKRMIKFFGDIFTIHGRSKNFGLTFALLQLKAPNKERGLDQEEIQSYLELNFHSISVSTISRILNQLADQEFCDNTEERTKDYGRKRLKYFRKGSFKKLLENRINYSIKEFERVSANLEEIKKNASDDAESENDDLLDLITSLTEMYGISIKLYQRLKVMSEKEMSSL